MLFGRGFRNLLLFNSFHEFTVAFFIVLSICPLAKYPKHYRQWPV